ncbi:hypothetical protein O6H91_21G040300 [Diphasiastrum complanatum]|uniref:Uncharacterized protein n=1 Tax=Diphasiastrum complanatum TaxID=34168 RepID=A0ACC2ALC7_DIPCM|nr:hypothetical protein O6H91_21G040300 [Diphasiastrum complanatum]
MEGDVAGSSRGNGADSSARFRNSEELQDWMNEEGDGSADMSASDVDMLKRAWRNEKAAPEVLPFQTLLVERVREQILLMEDNLVAFSGEISEELMLSLYRMDLDRTLFLLRAYLRTRLNKIEKFALHVLKAQELWDRLSEQEQDYAQRFTDSLHKHFQQTVLGKLPYGYQSIMKQATSSEEDDMIPEPNLDTFVFCRSKRAIGAFQLDEKGDETVDLMADDLYILRYRPIKDLLDNDRIELV